ncbi:conserved Plasmodium protein, unknown function [Plasmodium vinckei vinckei]|uniref:Uncharacterized protein n=1 Tax=Plasmodium vinckei vinckei TaxID=54757 RepID=A0A449BS00_PLAVN|nr:conserved Plasmodium protein, unknown function [Plasmodium vinckei vinckei]VEV56246.1 conserved Plasmodium protein, unknown function [Plasmodium vinckei vinckei]
MKWLTIKNVEVTISKIIIIILYIFLNSEKINCKRVGGLFKPNYNSKNLFNIYSVISKDVDLKNKNRYTQTTKDGINMYEIANKKSKVYFLPLVLEKYEKEPTSQTKDQTTTPIQQSNKSMDSKKENANDENQTKNIEDTTSQTDNPTKQTAFEYLENNLINVKKEIKKMTSYINDSDFLIVPINYNDILNQHIFDIKPFNNFVNSLDTIFVLNEQPKNNQYNVIFLIHNYNDKNPNEEKIEIMNIFRLFLKNHWKEKYDESIKDFFFFQNSNIIDIDKIGKSITPENLHIIKHDKKNNLTNIQNLKEENHFFKTYNPNTLKNISKKNYFLYNFFSNLKHDILQEYLKISKDLKLDMPSFKNIGKIDIKKTINKIEELLKMFETFQINQNIINNSNNFTQLKKKQYSYLLGIILTDLLERYEYNLEQIRSYLYQVYKENIKKIKISSNIIYDLKREMNSIDNLFEYYNSKISFLHYFKIKGNNFENKANYIYKYNKLKLLQILNETTSDIINYYISKGLYVRDYYFNSLIFSKKFTFLNYLLEYITRHFKNKININFNYLSPNAFGFSSYKDDISISPKKDVMITSSEINQVEKINIPASPYSKMLLSLEKK